MTISSTTRRVDYSGDDSETVFSYTFKLLDESHVKVTIRDSAGSDTTQTLSTHYTVSGVGRPTGGSITMVTAPATGETLIIERSVPKLQQTDLRNQGTFQPQTIEDALDYAMMAIQEITEMTESIIDAAGKPPIYTLAARPTASATWDQQPILVRDTGAPDQEQTCLRGAGGTWAWQVRAMGGWS